MFKPGMACFVAAILLGFSASAQTTRPDAEKQLAHDIYKQFVEIQSGYTTGATTPVAEAAASRLRAAGFAESDIFIGGAIPKKANLVARYHGTGTRKPILLLAHTDVVEAKREDWSMDPFQFVEKDGFYYGRGTGDDKAQAAVWVANLIQYKKEGFKPDRDIIVALTADEEGGGPYNGAEWLLKNHRDLIEAEYALNEGGWGEESNGRKLSNDLQLSEKYVLNFRLEVRNKGGHSSMPVPDNAIYHLASALDRLSKFGFPLKTNDVTSAYFREMSKIDNGPNKDALAKVAENSPEAMQRVAAASPAWNAMLRTTCVATMLEGGHAMNALPQLATANVNCRVLPEDTVEYVESTLGSVLADDQISVKLLRQPSPGPISTYSTVSSGKTRQLTFAVEYVDSTLGSFLADEQTRVKPLRQPSPGPISPLRPDLVDAARQRGRGEAAKSARGTAAGGVSRLSERPLRRFLVCSR